MKHNHAEISEEKHSPTVGKTGWQAPWWMRCLRMKSLLPQTWWILYVKSLFAPTQSSIIDPLEVKAKTYSSQSKKHPIFHRSSKRSYLRIPTSSKSRGNSSTRMTRVSDSKTAASIGTPMTTINTVAIRLALRISMRWIRKVRRKISSTPLSSKKISQGLKCKSCQDPEGTDLTCPR